MLINQRYPPESTNMTLIGDTGPLECVEVRTILMKIFIVDGTVFQEMDWVDNTAGDIPGALLPENLLFSSNIMVPGRVWMDARRW